MVTTVSTADGTTHFFDVSAGATALGKALAFVPKGIDDPEVQTVLVFFHGYNSTAGLPAYLASTPATRDLRPLLASKSVLFVEPWGGQNSDFSKFVTAAGLKALIDAAIAAAIDNAQPPRSFAGPKPAPKRVIFAAHSGGGMQLPLAANSSFAYVDQLTEVWALDCMYLGEGSNWVSWCRKNPGKTLRVRASTHPLSVKPRTQAEVISKAAAGGLLPNADIDVVDLAHDSFPPTYVPALIPRLHYTIPHHAAMTVYLRAQR